MNATWPFARLNIDFNGVRVESSSKRFVWLFRVFGLSDLAFDWTEIDAVHPRKATFPPWLLSNGVAFVVQGKEMIWWSPSKQDAGEILAEVERVAPRSKTD